MYLLPAAAYLVGSLPFGYLVGRLRGVDLFAAGSGNIGATNAGRVLGRKWGLLVFTLDFLKGAGPVAAATALDAGDGLRALNAAAAFAGHLYPVTLGFRGGKGVATGLGAVAVLVPVPAGLALAAWGLTVLVSRFVSLASLLAVAVLTAATVGQGASWPTTLFVVVGSLLVVVKHRANVRRLLAGSENQTRDGPMRHTVLKVVHVLAVGLWAGGVGFFSFLAAPAMSAEFTQVTATMPNSRTMHRDLLPNGTAAERKDLGSALFGTAVGPVFPRLFAVQTVCGVLAIATAFVWWPLGRVHRWRVRLLATAVILGGIGVWLSVEVSELRPKRFDQDPAVAARAKADFAVWHLASLGVTGVATLLAGVGLGLAAKLPPDQTD